MKKVIWFSRHEMNKAQIDGLEKVYGEIEINQINKTISLAKEIAEEISNAEVICIVAPIALQQEFLKLAEGRPVLICKNDRVAKIEGGFDFVHAGWFQIQEIKVVISDRLDN